MKDVRYAWSFYDADGFTGRHRSRESALRAAARKHAESVCGNSFPVAVYTARRTTFRDEHVEPGDTEYDFLVTDVQLHEVNKS